MSEAEESFVRELDVPLNLLPAFLWVPPMAGERKGAVSVGDGAVVGAGEESEGMREAAARFGGDVDLKGGAVSLQGQGGGGQCTVYSVQCTVFSVCLALRCRRRWVEMELGIADFEGVGFMGVDRVRCAEAVGSEEGFEASEGVGEFMRVA